MANGNRFIRTPENISVPDLGAAEADFHRLGVTMGERLRSQKITKRLREASIENEKSDKPKAREQLGMDIAKQFGDKELEEGFRDQLNQNMTLFLDRAQAIEDLHGVDAMMDFYNGSQYVTGGLLPEVKNIRNVDADNQVIETVDGFFSVNKKNNKAVKLTNEEGTDQLKGKLSQKGESKGKTLSQLEAEVLERVVGKDVIDEKDLRDLAMIRGDTNDEVDEILKLVRDQIDEDSSAEEVNEVVKSSTAIVQRLRHRSKKKQKFDEKTGKDKQQKKEVKSKAKGSRSFTRNAEGGLDLVETSGLE